MWFVKGDLKRPREQMKVFVKIEAGVEEGLRIPRAESWSYCLVDASGAKAFEASDDVEGLCPAGASRRAHLGDELLAPPAGHSDARRSAWPS